MRRWIQAHAGLWGIFPLVFLLLGWPVAIAFLFPPAGWRLARPWYYGGDFSQYLSAMHQGMAGAWRIVNRFTPEPHTPILQYPFYVALGHAARLLRIPPEALYGAAWGLGLLILWGSLIRLFERFLPTPRSHAIALALTLSSGPVWMLALGLSRVPGGIHWGNAALDAATRIEYNTFLALMAPPHLILALALLLIALLDLSAPPGALRKEAAFRIALAMLAIAWLNPFSLVTLTAWVGLRALLGLGGWRPAAWAELPTTAGPALLGAWLILYHVAIFHRDPFWGATYGQQNLQPPYPLPLAIATYGALGVLGIAGAIRAWRFPSGSDGFRQRFLALAAGGTLALSYTPLPYARRFAYGLGPLLAVLAAPVASRLLAHPAWRRGWTMPGCRVAMGVAVGILAYSQNAFLYAVYALSFLGAGPFPRAVFEPAAAFEAAAWLREQGPSVVVLACEADGNFLAGWIEGRVVLGHAGATLDVARKRAEVAAFWQGTLSKPEADTLLRRYGVTHLYYRTDSSCSRRRPEGVPVFERVPIQIFEVKERQ